MTNQRPTKRRVPTFYPIQSQWRKLKPIYESEEARKIWYPEMCAYLQVRREERNIVNGRIPANTPDTWPSTFDCNDWRCGTTRRGRHPGYWRFVCHSACHWVANLNLYVATKAEPDRDWQIISSDLHSTVWDAATKNLWETNFMAFGISARETYRMATHGEWFDFHPWVLMPHTEEVSDGMLLPEYCNFRSLFPFYAEAVLTYQFPFPHGASSCPRQ